MRDPFHRAAGATSGALAAAHPASRGPAIATLVAAALLAAMPALGHASDDHAGDGAASHAAGHAASHAASPPAGPSAGRAGEPAIGTAAPSWVHVAGKAHGSGVLVSYVPATAAPGQVATVRMRLALAPAGEGASVTVRDPGTGQTLLSLQLAPQERREVDLSVLARADGLQFLDVISTRAGRTSVVSIPLKVGSGRARLMSAGKPALTSSGEAVVVMPATTTATTRR